MLHRLCQLEAANVVINRPGRKQAILNASFKNPLAGRITFDLPRRERHCNSKYASFPSTQSEVRTYPIGSMNLWQDRKQWYAAPDNFSLF
jgi:hypothetical protein